MPEPTMIDLDVVEPPAMTIRLNSVDHPLKQITLEDWINNTREMEKFRKAGDGSLEAESNLIIAMVVRSFPTIDPASLRQIPLAKLNRLLEFVNGKNGSEIATKEAKVAAEGNPPVEEISPKS